MKKGEFVFEFLNAVWDISKGVFYAFSRESFHYKDLRIGGYNPEKIYRNVKNLQQRGILQKDGKGYFSFTKQGKQWARNSAQRHFKSQNQIWDNKWRIVIFDVPQELHHARIKLAARLRGWGFFMLQKSVYVFPHKCEEELGYLCQELKISDFVDVIVAENPGFREEEIRSHFSL